MKISKMVKKARKATKQGPFIMTVIGTMDNVAIDGITTNAAAVANATIAANAVTTQGDSGIITTGALTTAADTWEAAVTWTSAKIAASSVILLTVNTMTGTIGTNGVAHAVVTAKTAGSCTLRIGNIGANALSGAFTIGYRIINLVA